jgi:hypothetical protein
MNQETKKTTPDFGGFISRIQADLPYSFYDSCLWKENGEKGITISLQTDPTHFETLVRREAALIDEFNLGGHIVQFHQIDPPRQTGEERNRLADMSYSDADPGL